MIGLLVLVGTVCFAAGGFSVFMLLCVARDDVERMAHEDELWARRLARVAEPPRRSR